MRHWMLLWLLILPVWMYADDPRPVSAEEAKQLYAKLKELEGVWRGKSTKGWEAEMQIKVIAKGTAILHTSEFVGSPDEGMATLYYLDGDRLLLTHYCEAGNQPNMRATSKLSDGSYKFEFAGGTNLPSRDVGHMDGMTIRFVDADHFWSRWSWYSKGKEQWMEDIEYERVTAKTPSS